MPRYALLLEYDGSAFHGWQRQPNGASVQQSLEEAAAKLNGGVVPVSVAAGRTDAGVHGLGQVAEVEVSTDLRPDKMRLALNFHMLPAPVVVRAAAYAPEGWSPRFSALRRAYRYRILNRPARPALDAGRVWHLPFALDEKAMHRAAQALLGRHDFSAFRAAACQAKSPLRTLDRLDVFRVGEEVHIEAEARSFLHHQVRNLVGTLAPVGLGRRPESWPREVLDGQDRRKAGETAPPDGLCFMRVDYPEALDWH
ncbi:tRNA pseudouridine(38-40) synthase TruA [Rhodovarius crocodyli]|uniref:tRNA pseudouridine synthase A n=1 Tax=Rhodovarius crocodyli TaxID=1979269 RepID=A0A437LX42_9PROT|nr:tRNA pseudouridine(38-40) synthase TruA [Rhodovarius crocodyli]RVT89954.1 tRNA pseudouridine(38-40) synthase TruA [Rhodovarius crocodyli]